MFTSDAVHPKGRRAHNGPAGMGENFPNGSQDREGQRAVGATAAADEREPHRVSAPSVAAYTRPALPAERIRPALRSRSQRPKSRPKNPDAPPDPESLSHSQRRDAGTDFMTLSTCAPQPPQVVFLQVEQVTG